MASSSTSYVATVESVSTCPVNCEMCPVSRADVAQPKAQLMSLETAAIVATRLKHEFDVDFVAWGNWGEPLVHPQMVELTRVFARVGLRNQFLSTSLSVKIDADALVESDLAQLDVSLSGITAEVYNVGHKDGKWDLIRRNLEALSDAVRRKPGRLAVAIRWHRYKHNEHQLEAARAWAHELGFDFKPYFAHIGGIDALRDWDRGTLPQDKVDFVREHVFLEFVEHVIAQHVGETSCPMNRNLIVHPDGRLLHCCALMASHQSGADLLRESREALVRFKEGPNPYCAECLAKGWAGFTHSSKTEADLRAPLPAPAPRASGLRILAQGAAAPRG
ncbi:MAG: radical SAM protein [Planctomycetes bacterium]|nr:radical SAM protein [Planctomycetota bacterium]